MTLGQRERKGLVRADCQKRYRIGRLPVSRGVAFDRLVITSVVVIDDIELELGPLLGPRIVETNSAEARL